MICPMFLCAANMDVDTIITKICHRAVELTFKNLDLDEESGTDANTDPTPTVLVLDLTPHPAIHTSQNKQTKPNAVKTEQRHETNIIDTEQRYLNSVNGLNISDENNVNKYRELRTESSAIQTKADTFHSVALLPARKVATDTDQPCDLVNCQHMQGLCAVLRSYHDNDDEKTNHTIFDDNYTIAAALDDFHHLLFHNDHQFEDI
eukprot:942885_1